MGRGGLRHVAFLLLLAVMVYAAVTGTA